MNFDIGPNVTKALMTLGAVVCAGYALKLGWRPDLKELLAAAGPALAAWAHLRRPGDQ